jgi:hypothetical protein
MDAQSQIKITVKEIQEILPKLSGPEILELDRKIHEYLDTMAYPEEAIYDET